jgi:DNA replication protein DnaC
MEAIELHRLASIIRSKGGQVLDLATDSVSCVFPDDVLPLATCINVGDKVLVDGYFYDDAQSKRRYKLEDKDRLRYEHMPLLERQEKYEYSTYKWKTTYDGDDNDFTKYVDEIISSNASWHIDGRGGTGKSTLVKLLQQRLTDEGKQFVSLAPTNIAARIIKGQTVHKFMVDRSLKKYAKVDYIFVDEISMAHEFMYKFFMLLKRKYQVKFIIAGDFEQLLPVKDRIEDCNYKDSRALYELCDGNRIQLLKCRRADDELFNLCDPKTIMQLDKEIFGKQFTDAHLCFTNKKRKEINNTMMQKATKGCKPLCLPALPYDGNSQDVMLAPGMPVICRVTRNKLNICNNEMFTIQSVSQQSITLANDNAEVEIEP